MVTRIDLLKMLLYAPGESGSLNSPIRGKTRLQKEVFLAQKNLKGSDMQRKYGFMPYHYGPFSRQLYFDINFLKKRGIVEERPYCINDNGIYREFKLTEKGMNEVEHLLQDKEILRIYENIKNIKNEYDNMALKDLVEFTHQEYPEYVLNQEY